MQSSYSSSCCRDEQQQQQQQQQLCQMGRRKMRQQQAATSCFHAGLACKQHRTAAAVGAGMVVALQEQQQGWRQK
jgi:hypothetical protein